MEQPKKGFAIASLVLGIVTLVISAWGIPAIVTGIIGVVLGSLAKKAGNTSTMRKVGFILSLIGLILAIVLLVACTACGASMGSLMQQ